ncbi:hypothetical protein FACS1894190_05410 [Spirochaetia bacterium]|nr:hypothetical protein FACS1894190_05410 [Spirochaetia bacterium]
MTEYIAHRVNTIADLKELDSSYGVEIDLRDNLDGRIYLQHDPFIKGDDFEEYLHAYHHGTMILNIKSERVELKALGLLEKYNINNYFFLDSSFPMIKTLSDRGNTQCSLRFSEFEGLDTIHTMKGRVSWVWVDCFSLLPLTKDSYNKLKDWNYKICIVSPELQGQEEKIETYAGQLKHGALIPDAICTKVYNIDKWRNYFK